MSSPPVRVACCGGQLVKSAHPETSLGSDAEFPERLQQRLGERYEVGNFGYASAYVCSVCVDAAGPGMPEWAPSLLWHKSPPAAACAEFLPDVILLGPFGKHDCLAPFGWLDRMDEESYDRAPLFTQENWEAGLREMVQELTAQHPAARIVLLQPVPFPSASTVHAVATLALPATLAVAAELGLATIDLFTPFCDQGDAFPDADHLNSEATEVFTDVVLRELQPVLTSRLESIGSGSSSSGGGGQSRL